MQELNKATRARVSSVQWGEAKLEAKRSREARLDHLGSIVSFIFLSIPSISFSFSLSLERFGKQDQR